MKEKTKDDLISRQAAFDAIDKNRQELLSLGMDGAEHDLVHYGRRVIEELPTIELKHPTLTDGLPPEVLKAAEELGEYIGQFINAVMEFMEEQK